MRERRKGRTPHHAPAIARPDGSAAPVHSDGESAHGRNVGLSVENLDLAFEPRLVTQIVCIHPRHEGGP